MSFFLIKKNNSHDKQKKEKIESFYFKIKTILIIRSCIKRVSTISRKKEDNNRIILIKNNQYVIRINGKEVNIDLS